MESDERETNKLIPCEGCGAEAKLLCFCRKASLCEHCVGRHLLAEPNLPHKPISYSQSELAALYEQEFSHLRQSEARLLRQVADRYDFVTQGRARLLEEIQKLQTFKCTCLEFVAVAVEVMKQKLAEAAEAVGKEMVETCEGNVRVLEEAIRALEAGEPHWVEEYLQKEKATIWQGNVDLKEIDLVAILRNGIDFKLSLNRPEVSAAKVAEKSAAQKPARKLSQKLEAAQKPKPESQKPIQSVPKSACRSSARVGLIEPKLGARRQPAAKLNHSPGDGESLTVRNFDCPSPDPPSLLTRCMTESPSSGHFGLGSRAALLQQTAKHVNEVSDMVKSMKSPRTCETAVSASFSQRPRGPMPLGELNYSCSPAGSPVSKTSTHFGSSRKSESSDDFESQLRSSLNAMPEVIPEEPSNVRAKPCLYCFTPGTSSLVIRDLETSLSSVKTFDGIDAFPKQTFWCTAPSGDVFVIGGVVFESQPSSVRKSCLIYSPLNDTIESGPNLTTARHSCAAVCVKDTLFVTGGVGSDLCPLKDCEKLDLKTRKWRRIANMNVPRESHGVTVHLGRMYVAGAPGEQSMETYNPINDRWALLHFKVSAGGEACVLSLGDRVAILHDKALTYAWVDKRTSKHVRDLEEKGWWTSGAPVRHGGSFFLQRGAAVYEFSVDSSSLARLET